MVMVVVLKIPLRIAKISTLVEDVTAAVGKLTFRVVSPALTVADAGAKTIAGAPENSTMLKPPVGAMPLMFSVSTAVVPPLIEPGATEIDVSDGAFTAINAVFVNAPALKTTWTLDWNAPSPPPSLTFAATRTRLVPAVINRRST